MCLNLKYYVKLKVLQVRLVTNHQLLESGFGARLVEMCDEPGCVVFGADGDYM